MNIVIYFKDTRRTYMENIRSIEHDGKSIIISNDYSSAENVCNIMINNFIEQDYHESNYESED